ncbi:heat shock protein 60 family chaperone GroEL [Cutibacterium acnes JCM 18909]|nr:heat shock protein 60 family chaperone GroEL [Cutibacterium acnes JCM 18909]
MVREGLRNVTAGANPMGLKKGIEPPSRLLVLVCPTWPSTSRPKTRSPLPPPSRRRPHRR